MSFQWFRIRNISLLHAQMCNIEHFVSHRTAVTLGTSSGLTVLLLIILGGICVYNRDKLRKNLEFSKIRGKLIVCLMKKKFNDKRNMSSMSSCHPYAHVSPYGVLYSELPEVLNIANKFNIHGRSMVTWVHRHDRW